MNQTMVVRRKYVVADDVVAVELANADGAPLPAWTPGSHVDVHLPDGIVRQYSLCGDPSDDSWRIGVLREVHGRGGSRYVHDRLREGDLLDVGGPRNNFALDDARGYCFIAGGIGVTPLLPMMQAVSRRGLPMQIHYGGRRRASMAFVEEISRYGAAASVIAEDECGLLPLEDILRGLPSGWVVYCCGPEPLIQAVEAACSERLDIGLRLERFSAVTPVLDADALDSYTVVLRRSNHEVPVKAGLTLLEAIESAGIAVQQECREGICGACETTVLEGVPVHRDSILTQAEKERCSTMFVCVSGSRSPVLVLDL